MSKRCSRCKSTNVRRSKIRNVFEQIAKLLGFRFYRCRDCGKRFFHFL